MKPTVHTQWRRNLRLNKSGKRVLLLAALIIMMSIVAAMLSSEFLQPKNLINILANNAIYGIMGVGMTLVIITGSIDVSVGAQFAVIGMLVGAAANWLDAVGVHSVLLIFLFAALCGVVLGLFNGIMVAKLHLPAVIVTLATMSIFRGLLLFITDGAWIALLPRWYTTLASAKFLGIHLFVYLWFFLVLLMVLFIRYTKKGRQILALGGNPTAAMRLGIKPAAIYLFVFVLWGMIIGIASTVYVAQLGGVQPTAGIGYEMTLIAAVILGGNRLTGGRANFLGTVLGVILLGVLNNIMVLAQIPMYWQSLLTGMVLLLAIVFSCKEKNRLLQQS